MLQLLMAQQGQGQPQPGQGGPLGMALDPEGPQIPDVNGMDPITMQMTMSQMQGMPVMGGAPGMDMNTCSCGDPNCPGCSGDGGQMGMPGLPPAFAGAQQLAQQRPGGDLAAALGGGTPMQPSPFGG